MPVSRGAIVQSVAGEQVRPTSTENAAPASYRIELRGASRGAPCGVHPEHASR